MLDVLVRQAVGPYLLTRALEPGVKGDRFLALHESDQSSHLALRLPMTSDRDDVRRFVDAVRVCESIRHEHLLPIEYHTIDADGHPWLITPFPGDVDGVRSLGKLLREKQGQMHPAEAERAVQHALEAIDFAHRLEPARDGREARLPVVNGAWSMDEILVDRHGRVLLELYGLPRLLAGETAAADAETIRDEVRSIVDIAYQLITGLRAESPMIPAGRLVKRLDSNWDRWLSRGLDASWGFDTAADALAALPSRVQPGAEFETVGVRGVFGRLRPW